MSADYEQKFASFLRMCVETKKGGVEVVVVHHPEVLGDNYVEIIESLNRLADAHLMLSIVPRADRGSN